MLLLTFKLSSFNWIWNIFIFINAIISKKKKRNTLTKIILIATANKMFSLLSFSFLLW